MRRDGGYYKAKNVPLSKAAYDALARVQGSFAPLKPSKTSLVEKALVDMAERMEAAARGH